MLLNTYWGAAFVVIGSVFLAVCGLFLARKLVHFEKLKPAHEVGGYMLGVVGAIYAVLLGLIVVDAMQVYQRARDVTEQETYSLANIAILADGLHEPNRSAVRNLCSSYATQVADSEFGRMAEGTYCPIANTKATDLMKSLIGFQPVTEAEKIVYPQILQESSSFWQIRQQRLSLAERSIPGIEWFALIIGASITIFFTYFFGLENLRLQMIMTGLVATLMSLNLVLLLMFAYPFSGVLSLKSQAYTDFASAQH